MAMAKYFRRYKIFVLIGISFFKAWRIKFGKDITRVEYNYRELDRKLCDADISLVMGWVEAVVRYGAIRTRRKCFFRAYIAAVVLNRLGCPVEMNIGLKGRGKQRIASGHCWLTLNDRILCEESNPIDNFPIEIAQAENGIRYWAGHSL